MKKRPGYFRDLLGLYYYITLGWGSLYPTRRIPIRHPVQWKVARVFFVAQKVVWEMIWSFVHHILANASELERTAKGLVGQEVEVQDMLKNNGKLNTHFQEKHNRQCSQASVNVRNKPLRQGGNFINPEPIRIRALRRHHSCDCSRQLINVY